MIYVLMGFIVIAFAYDSKTSRIPNWLNFLGLTIGMMINIILMGVDGLVFSGSGVLLGFTIMLVLYFFGAVGAGDVKLFAAIGSMIGAFMLFNVMCYAVLYAGVIGIAILIYRRLFKRTVFKLYSWFFHFILSKEIFMFQELKNQQNLQFPFMYAVLPAYATVWFLYFY